MKPRIEFISTARGLPSDCSPYPAKLKRPGWMTLTDQQVGTRGTIRRCPGIIDFTLQGYIVPLWSDLVINYDSSSLMLDVSFNSDWALCNLHGIEQFKATPLENYAYPYGKVIKLEVPWRIKLSNGYSSLIVDPLYHDKSPALTVIPGLIDHDSFHTANVFLLFNLYGCGTCIVKRGTPIYQVMPTKRVEYAMTIRAETGKDKAENEHEGNIVRSIKKNYWKTFWKKK